MTNTREKYRQIKTIIYRHIPKDLYSFYECVGVKYGNTVVDTSKVENLLKVGNRIIITGTGGIGKSTLLRHLFLNTSDDSSYIPVLIELRSFNSYENKDISLYEAMYSTLKNNGFELSDEWFDYSLREGAYVVLFDGFDEVNKDKIEIITNEVKKIAESYGKNHYIVSSRPMAGFIGWNDFCEVETMELTKTQAISLIKKIEFDESVKEFFCEQLERKLYDQYRSFASNPLLLNIMLLTFQKHASIPDRLNDFYEEAFVTLFNAHDATKDAYVRDIRSGLSCEDFKYIFSYICFKTYFAGEFEFTDSKLMEYILKAQEKLNRKDFTAAAFQEDLTLSVCMLVKEGLTYRFSHRSFQEYFAAYYTCKLTDDIQVKLLQGWIKESATIVSDKYFSMLFDLQRDKVNKIVLIPILKLVIEKYNELGFSFEFLSQLFSSIKIWPRYVMLDSISYPISLVIKDDYYCNALMLNSKLNGQPKHERPNDCQREMYESLCDLKGIPKENRISATVTVTFDELKANIKEEDVIASLKWFEEDILFAKETVTKYEESVNLRKKKVISILEEL